MKILEPLKDIALPLHGVCVPEPEHCIFSGQRKQLSIFPRPDRLV